MSPPDYAGVLKVLYDWQTLITGILALIAAVATIRVTINAANREISAAQEQTSTTVVIDGFVFGNGRVWPRLDGGAARLTTGKGAGFRSLGDTWADTTTAHGRLMVTVLGGLAEFERELIRARTSEGRARAKARGQSLGRLFKLTPHQKQEAVRRRDAGKETLVEIGRSYNVSAATISRL